MAHRREYTASHGSLSCDVIDIDTNEVVERINFNSERIATDDTIPSDILDIYHGRVSDPVTTAPEATTETAPPAKKASTATKAPTAKKASAKKPAKKATR